MEKTKLLFMQNNSKKETYGAIFLDRVAQAYEKTFTYSKGDVVADDHRRSEMSYSCCVRTSWE